MQIHQLKKEFGDRVLFDQASLSIQPGERIGLVGRNGAGKSTFFKILLGELAPDAGEVVLPKGYKIGALSQHIHFTKPNILDEVLLALPPEQRDQTHLAEKILFGLGFEKADLVRDPQSFSGGYQVRLNLVKALLGNPNLLLLDEPTNYLDILSLRWLKRFLMRFPGEVILITHDRGFMDQVVTHVVGITRRELRKVKGTTALYYQQITQEEELHEKTRQNQERKRKELEGFVERFRAKASKAAQAQSRLKQLEKMETLDALEQEKRLAFRFGHKPCSGKIIMEVQDLSFGHDPAKLLFENLSFSLGREDRLAIIGKNGMGKSTLLNVLAGNLVPTSGSISFHPSLALGHFGQTNVERLSPDLTIEEELTQHNTDLSRVQVRSIAGLMMFEGDQAEKKIKVLSGGEKSRVLLGKILCQQNNLLFLDEPTNHLDMESVESLTEAIEKFEGAVCLVTHNEELLKRVATRLIVFRRGKAEYFYGGYDDFLKKIGWDEDEREEAAGPKLSHKELKQQRSEWVIKRSKALKPLREKEAELEAVIVGLEKLLGLKEAALVKASEDGKGDEIQTLSQELAELNEKIESLFSKLEEVAEQISAVEEQFPIDE